MTNYYKIGGITFEINWENILKIDDYSDVILEQQFLPFLDAYGIPVYEMNDFDIADVSINMLATELPTEDKDYICIENQFYNKEGDDYLVEFRNEQNDHVRFVVEISDYNGVSINAIRNEDVFPLRRLRTLAAAFNQIAPKFNGFVMHGAGIEYNGQGIVFTAYSGTGKTTQARLWRKYRGATVINGDSPLIKQEETGVMMYGTPWCGSSGESINKSVPLKAIVLINRSDSNSVQEITGDDKILAVYTNIIYFSRNKADFELLMDVYESIIKQVRVFTLNCNMTEDAVATLEAEIFK